MSLQPLPPLIQMHCEHQIEVWLPGTHLEITCFSHSIARTLEILSQTQLTILETKLAPGKAFWPSQLCSNRLWMARVDVWLEGSECAFLGSLYVYATELCLWLVIRIFWTILESPDTLSIIPRTNSEISCREIGL